MADSVYKVIELVGTSSDSWEKAASAAVKLASKSLRDMRVAEVVELDMTIEDGIALALKALKKTSDVVLKPDTLEITVCTTKKKTFELLTTKEVEKYLK
mgnify:CR=1 FL=1